MAKYLQISLVVCVVYITGTFAFVDDKIVGGRPGNNNEFPYQVSLRNSYNNDEHFCGGSLISSCHILTAAHCMYCEWGERVPLGLLKVVGGQNDLKLTENSIWSNAFKIHVHEEYDHVNLYNDIAIIELENCFPIDNEKIAFVELNTRTPREGTNCIVSGWGVTKYGDQKLSNELLAADVSIIDKEVCQNMYSKANIQLSPGMICAGVSDGSKDACQADSGGPLFCNYKLAGIVSAGIGCGNADYPGYYTDISQYLPWIQNILDEKNNRLNDEL